MIYLPRPSSANPDSATTLVVLLVLLYQLPICPFPLCISPARFKSFDVNLANLFRPRSNSS